MMWFVVNDPFCILNVVARNLRYRYRTVSSTMHSGSFLRWSAHQSCGKEGENACQSKSDARVKEANEMMEN